MPTLMQVLDLSLLFVLTQPVLLPAEPSLQTLLCNFKFSILIYLLSKDYKLDLLFITKVLFISSENSVVSSLVTEVSETH